MVIIPDNDAAGYRHAEQVARSLHGVAQTIRIVRLPDLPGNGDVSDWLDAEHTLEQLHLLVEETLLWVPSQATADTREPSDTEDSTQTSANSGRRRSQAELLIALGSDLVLFHTPDSEAYATFQVGNHVECWPVKGRAVRRFLVHRFYKTYGKPPHREALQNVCDLLEAKALFDGAEERVYVRLAEQDGRIYLDLGNADWEAVEVSESGWRIVPNVPVKFLRRKGFGALPYPERGGAADDLQPFVNVGCEEDYILLLAWLVNALRPHGPYPVLVLHGEQGTAKSTAARVLRSLCDPNTAPLRFEPRDASPNNS